MAITTAMHVVTGDLYGSPRRIEARIAPQILDSIGQSPFLKARWLVA